MSINNIEKKVNIEAIFWFRRDLRFFDNKGFFESLKHHESVLPIFIFDSNILEKLNTHDDPRVSFIYETIQHLKKKFEENNSSLAVFNDTPYKVFDKLSKLVNLKAVYCNHDYEPYALERDKKVENILKRKGIEFRSFKDQVVFEKNDILKNNGGPYTVYTPYMNKWRSNLEEKQLHTFPSEDLLDHLVRVKPYDLVSLSEVGFSKNNEITVGPPNVDEKIIKTYDEQRDFPAIQGTSRLSVHLRFGTVSIRELVKIALKYNSTWLNELIWREFFMMILWHFPKVVDHAFKPAYDRIPWRNNEEEFKCWCKGQTGFPIVDAGMRELNQTGFMHNRVRMVTASFLVKHLLIDWRWGEAYFAEKLLDYELASNNGNWQWAAGCGCDAAPYFRVFNPTLQVKKFDPEHLYVKKWIPEFNDIGYPTPIVDHKEARKRAIAIYKKALGG